MSVRLAQMRWKGMVSQLGNMSMRSRLARAKIVHTVSITRAGYGQPRRGSFLASSPGHELIALTPHGLDQVEAQLGAEAADAHVNDVGPRVELVAPDGGEQLALGDRVPRVLRELAQQQELEPGEMHRAVADVRHQPGHVEGDLAGPDDLAAQPDPDPGEQFGEGERLGQVVLGAAFEQVD